MLGWSVVFGIWLLIGAFIWGGFAEALYNILPKGQKIATTCYVEEKIEEAKTEVKAKVEKSYDGYFYEGNKKINGRVIDQMEKDIKIEYGTRFGWKQKWLPKKDFHCYYTIEELSELYNKTKKK